MEDTRKDRLMASLACVVLAAMLGGLAVWLGFGLVALEADRARLGDRALTRSDPSFYGLYLIPVAGLLGIAALGLLGLAVWIPLAGRRRR